MPMICAHASAGCLTENLLTYDSKSQMYSCNFSVLFSYEFSIHIFALFFLKYVLKIHKIYDAFFLLNAQLL